MGSPLPIPADDNLAYVLNDEQLGGRLAAERALTLIHGHGEVALIGIDPDIAGIMVRAQSFEQSLTEHNPQVHIVVRRMGTFNYGHEQESAEEVLRGNPELNVIVALTAPATQAAISTIQVLDRSRAVKVIGFDPESLPFENPSLDSVIVENTRGMGEQAVRLIHARLQGHPFPARVEFKPTLVTRDNLGTPEVQTMLYARWCPDAADLERSVTP